MTRRSSPKVVTPWRPDNERASLTPEELQKLQERITKLFAVSDLNDFERPKKIQEKILLYGRNAYISKKEMDALTDMFRRFGVE